MISSATTTASGYASTKCQPTVQVMASSVSCMMRPRRRSAKLSRTHPVQVRPRKLVTSINHLWIPMPSKLAAYLLSQQILPASMPSKTTTNSSLSWQALKCAASAESLELPSIPMRWIPIPTFSIWARVGYRYPMSPTTAKNSSPKSAQLSWCISKRCAPSSESQMAHK